MNSTLNILPIRIQECVSGLPKQTEVTNERETLEQFQPTDNVVLTSQQVTY